MHITPFDFDVITGPSVPRDQRKPDPRQEGTDQLPDDAPPAQPQTR